MIKITEKWNDMRNKYMFSSDLKTEYYLPIKVR